MDYFVALLIKYKYIALFPVAAFEGPVVSLIVGFLVRLGYLEFIPAFCILILGDIIPDTIYYYIGRLGNKKNVVEKYFSKSSFFYKNFSLVEKLWKNHPKKTMFFSKVTYGLATPFLISAGLVKMPFKKFISYTIPITLFQFGTIMTIGYLLGHSYELATPYIKDATVGLIFVAIFIIAIYSFFVKYARKQISNMEEYDK